MSTTASLARIRTSASASAAVLAAALSALPAAGQTWLPTAGGSYDYNNGANWSTGAVPNGVGATVNLNGNILDTHNIYVYSSTKSGR
jgi:outer membrane protease